MLNVHTQIVSRLIALVAVILTGSALSQRAFAQADAGNDFSLFIGYMLPNQIDGVTEILPLFGGRYSFGLPAGAVEVFGENAHAEGVDWTSFGVSLRGEIPVMHGISGLIYGGPNFHYYAPAGSIVRRSDYGVHFGVAGLMLVSDTFWLRTDLKFMGNPGTAMYLLFGLMFRTSAGN